MPYPMNLDWCVRCKRGYKPASFISHRASNLYGERMSIMYLFCLIETAMHKWKQKSAEIGNLHVMGLRTSYIRALFYWKLA